MLTCKVGKRIINTFEYKEEKIREWSNKGMLKCPICGSEMVYCHGDYKIPYFRHKQDGDCPDIYSEGITQEHLNGTRILYEWLKKQNNIKNLTLEKWLEETRQRPDIYFEMDNQKYAIEFQCSPIATKYNDRKDLYRLNNINDIWILGVDKYDVSEYKSLESVNLHNQIIDDIKTKAIEREVKLSEKPLLYLTQKGYLIKLIDDFIPISKNHKEDYKTKFDFIIDIKNINCCNAKDILINDSLYICDNTMIGYYLNKIDKKVEYLNRTIEEQKWKKELLVTRDYIELLLSRDREGFNVYHAKLENFDIKKLNKAVFIEKNKIEKRFEEVISIKNACKKLNNQFSIVNLNCKFDYAQGSGLYLWKIIFDCNKFERTFFIKNNKTDITETASYTTPFRGKRGGIGWARKYYYSNIGSFEYENFDIGYVFDRISDAISDTLRTYKYKNNK